MIKREGNKIFYSGSESKMTEHAAALIISDAYAAIADHGRFSLVLAGGNTPRPLYRHLAEGVDTDLFKHYKLHLPKPEQTHGKEKIIQMPWQQTWLFWGDERCVPFDDPDSNYRMVKETLLLHAPVPEDHLFRMHADLPNTARAARDYETAIREFFATAGNQYPEKIPVFDLVLLGLGEDGHTASLFAGNPEALEDTTRLVLSVEAPHAKPPGKRLTMTLTVINHARNVVFFTSGKEKASLAEQIFHQKVRGVPASLVAPGKGKLFWFTAQP
jgi:6-phosphogluconolactonase